MYHSRRLVLFALSLLITLAISGGLVLALNNPAQTDPENAVLAAFERARTQDSYHVVADIDQTMIPRAMVANLGKSDKTSAMRILGDVAQGAKVDGSPDQRARMQFYAGAGQAPVEMMIAGDEAFVGYQGKWEKVDDPMSGVAPGADYLGYLVAVENVSEAEIVNTAEGSFNRHTFSINGETYAEYQRQRTQEQMAGQLPNGVEIQPHPVHMAMSGDGELWIDSEGLPRRQILSLSMPGVSERYDAQVEMII
ncbi:MAG: hypothetical protein GY759_22365, partial [Chloroflexi bacterium]|nr:hypothetical protein [Chloroflexota bacterium]